MSFNKTDVTNLLSILKSGKENAQTAASIEAELNNKFGFPISGNQVKARALITYAIELGHLIKSSPSQPAGYWLETNPKEIMKCIKSLKKRARKISNRANNLKRNLR